MPVSATTIARQCTLCEAHCGILVTVEDQQVTRIEGNPDDVLSQGYICPKATAMGGLHHDPDRLRTPVRRVGDSFEPIGWDEAFAEIGRRLRAVRGAHGTSAIGMYLGNPAAHSSSVIYGALLRAVLLTKNFFTASSIDQFPQEFVAWRMFGSNVLMPVVDIDRTDRLVVLGANPAVSNGSITTMPGAKLRIKEVRKRGGKVVVIDPRRTETARLADEHVAVTPGGDPYLLLGMLHVLVTEKLCDEAAIAKQCSGWGEIRALVADFTPEQAAPFAGVDAQVIRRLAREHAAAESAVLYARLGVCLQVTGTLTHWLVNIVNAATGNLDRPGGHMFATPPIDAARFAKYLPVGHGAWTDSSGRFKSFRSELPVAVLTDEIRNGTIRAMVTYAGNPVLSTPNRGELDAALEGLDFYVAVDMYVTETTRHADIILPPISPLEREDLDVLLPVFSVRNNLRYNARVFDPPADGLEDWQIMARLVTEMLPLPARGVTTGALHRLFEQFSPLRLSALGVATGPYGVLRRGLRGLTVGKVRESAGGVDLGPLRPRLRQLIGTKDRKVQLAPPDFLAAARALLDDVAHGAQATADGYDLRLIGRRHLRSNNSWLHNVPAMVKGKDRCTALMHPADAAARHLTDGAPVTVTSKTGSIVVPVEVSDDIRPGTIAVPHGWGHQEPGVGWQVAASLPGKNVNALHDPSLTDTFSGAAAVNSTWVRVQAAEPADTPADTVAAVG
ncbi:molybdopterin oxidoreductase family protein [Nocardia sp. NPDC051832]|uniref:molybdopterin oxidoreductase family protein n=1 Tax=Nocardia sp. NPDC051832 TaxID=3155673 RepID=UPI00343D8597